jgi:pyrroloquinoline quinone biosynthesis protein B
MRALGISDRTAREIGHVPISGPRGSLEWLASLPSRERVYTHINNTNPILLEDSPERCQVRAAGIDVGLDGLRLTA